MKIKRLTAALAGTMLSTAALTATNAAYATDPGPDPIVQSDIRVLAEKVGTMPRKLGPGLFFGGPDGSVERNLPFDQRRIARGDR